MLGSLWKLLLAIVVQCAIGEYVSNVTVCMSQWSQQRLENGIITFIMPSMSRSTLPAAIDSLLKLENPNWLLTVVFDGVVTEELYLNTTSQLPFYYNQLPKYILHDNRICFIHAPINRANNCAGGSRNYAIGSVKTKWVGFIDDDDTLNSKYVDYLLEHEASYPTARAILFRMCSKNDGSNHLIPHPNAQNIEFGGMGISFTAQSALFLKENYWFRPSNMEDFQYLFGLKWNNIPFLISPHMAYQVRGYNGSECYVPAVTTLLENQGEAARRQRNPPETCQRGKVGPTSPIFTFVENDDPVYQSHLAGLQNSLTMALNRRCHGSWRDLPETKIEILFNASQIPTSPFFIQIQYDPSNPMYMTPLYQSKVKNALQIWDLQPSKSSILTDENTANSTQFIPSMLLLQQDPMFSCRNFSHEHKHIGTGSNSSSTKHEIMHIVSQSLNKTFAIYRRGYYYHCRVNEEGDSSSTKFQHRQAAPCRRISSSSKSSSYCYRQSNDTLSGEEICRHAVGPFTIDILLLGKIRGSDDNRLEAICDSMIGSRGNKGRVVCMEEAYDKVLQHLICMAHIVVVVPASKHAGLETYRIDPLLQAGKIAVASEPFSSTWIDTLYGTVIPIVPVANIAETTYHILRNHTAWLVDTHYHRQRKEFVHAAMSNIDPLCSAMSQIEGDLKHRLQHSSR